MALGSKMAGCIGVQQALLAWLLLLALQSLNYNWTLPQLKSGPGSGYVHGWHATGRAPPWLLAFGWDAQRVAWGPLKNGFVFRLCEGCLDLFSEPKHDSKTIKNMRISQCCMGKFSTYSNTQDWLQGYSMEVESLQRFQKLTKLRLGRAIWVEAPNIVPVFSDSASSEFLAWSRAPCYVRF